MTSQIKFKFKSATQFDVVTFSGMVIRLLDLKRAIVERKGLNKGIDFDLAVTNAQSDEGACCAVTLFGTASSRAPMLCMSKRESRHVSLTNCAFGHFCVSLAERQRQPRPTLGRRRMMVCAAGARTAIAACQSVQRRQHGRAKKHQRDRQARAGRPRAGPARAAPDRRQTELATPVCSLPPLPSTSFLCPARVLRLAGPSRWSLWWCVATRSQSPPPRARLVGRAATVTQTGGVEPRAATIARGPRLPARARPGTHLDPCGSNASRLCAEGRVRLRAPRFAAVV